MTPLEVFEQYLAVKNHLTTPYNYIESKGQIKAIAHIYQKQKTPFHFENIARSVSSQIMTDVFVANLIDNPKLSISKIYKGDMIAIYRKWKKKQNQLMYFFKKEIKELFEALRSRHLKFVDLFKIHDDKDPVIIMLYKEGILSLETLTILNQIVKYAPHYPKHYKTKEMRALARLIEKYNDFLTYDKNIALTIVKEQVSA